MATNTPLQSIKLTSSSSTVTFSNISQDYTDLVIVCNLKTVVDDSLVLRFNGDSSASYSRTNLGGNGSDTKSTRGSGNTTGIVCTYGYATTANFNATSTLKDRKSVV
jgi:hypothetical protein